MFQKLVAIEPVSLVPSAEKTLYSFAGQVVMYPDIPASDDEIIARIGDADAVLLSYTSRINRYVNNVAAAFHRFYTVSRIRDAETEALRDARVYLIRQVATVIENGLSVFGVTAPDKM